ncbi:MAG TPA: nucleotidyltransferase family protein, partial [Azonexus sp.]|nr:nucleotidyltransferase family protein [Azonexus sp.]
MRALLLAAGTGTRLAPLTHALPKCLAPINGVPLLAYWLEALSACGIERFLINTHYRAEQVQDFVRRSPWAERIDLIHESELQGTGGTLHATRDWWQDDDLLLVHADNLCHCDFAAFIAAH